MNFDREIWQNWILHGDVCQENFQYPAPCFVRQWIHVHAESSPGFFGNFSHILREGGLGFLWLVLVLVSRTVLLSVRCCVERSRQFGNPYLANQLTWARPRARGKHLASSRIMQSLCCPKTTGNEDFRRDEFGYVWHVPHWPRTLLAECAFSFRGWEHVRPIPL